MLFIISILTFVTAMMLFYPTFGYLIGKQSSIVRLKSISV